MNKIPIGFLPSASVSENEIHKTCFLLPPSFQVRDSSDPVLLGDLKEPDDLGLGASVHLFSPPKRVRAISLGLCFSKQWLQGVFTNRYNQYKIFPA